MNPVSNDIYTDMMVTLNERSHTNTNHVPPATAHNRSADGDNLDKIDHKIQTRRKTASLPPSQKSYKDAASSAMKLTRNPPANPIKAKSIPWKDLSTDIRLAQLPPRQREAIIKPRQALLPLSRNTSKKRGETTTIYFSGVRRAP